MCPDVVEDPHLGESDVQHSDRCTHQVDGVDGAFGVMPEVSAEDCQGSFLLAGVVGEDGVVWGRE